jgi:zinc transport system substrate-binding protein
MQYRVIGHSGGLFGLIIAKLGCFVICFVLGLSVSAADAAVKIVATIRPVYSLLASLTQGVSQPTLLLKHQASPHHYTLRPSEKQLLKEADFIFWIGPELESFLPSILATIPSDHYAIRLDKTPGLQLLPMRTGKSWVVDTADEQGHLHHHHGVNSKDPHIWLSPDNAAKMSSYMTDVLIQYDPAHRTQYENNLKALKDRLKTLDAAIKKQLKASSNVPFLVFHDGYQYFERAYGLKGVGAISINPELPMSSRRVKQVQDKIQHMGVCCLFSEPQWGTRLVDVLAKKYQINVGMLDPLGAETQKPSEDYFVNLSTLANTIQTCLSSKD